MALPNIFKRRPKEKPATEPKLTEKPKEIKRDSNVVPKKERISAAYRILKFPHVTEKATDLTQREQYVFKVYPEANKIEIKKAIEDIYGVDVTAVKIINVPRKKRRLGRTTGWRKGYKKAIVKIKEGQKIEIMPK